MCQFMYTKGVLDMKEKLENIELKIYEALGIKKIKKLF